jgi:two-component system, NtrC family, sensor kinase
MRILIADDDGATCTLVKRALERSGFDVVVATDGVSASALVERCVPELAILDWMMPGLNGIELCQRIRANPLYEQMYILLSTGRTGADDIVSGLEAGADDYLMKPIDLSELGARVRVGARMVQANAERDRLLDSISSILIRVNAAGLVTRWNTAAQRTFGIPSSAIVGRSLKDADIRWTSPQTARALLEQPTASARLEDLAFTDSAGNLRLVGLTITMLQRGSGHSEAPDGFVVLGAEVTTTRTLEEQLRQAQKLEGLGQLASGIAHEINTPMQYIGDNVRFLQDAHTSLSALFDMLIGATRDGHSAAERAALVESIAAETTRAELAYFHEELPRAIQQSLDGVQHVSHIVKAMKDFAHPGTGAKVPVDVNRAIETTLVIARNELKYVADTDTNLEPSLPLVPCLPGEINQVLLNLLINAAHAIADAREAEPDRPHGRISVATRRVDDTVEIRVGDTGTGIPEESRRRVFEPFFTTKTVGRGTGQGLTLAHSVVVKRHGGQIWFETETGKGTTFIVRLPVNDAGCTVHESAFVDDATADVVGER